MKVGKLGCVWKQQKGCEDGEMVKAGLEKKAAVGAVLSNR